MKRLFREFRYLIGWLTDDELYEELKNRRPLAVWMSERRIDAAIARLKADEQIGSLRAEVARLSGSSLHSPYGMAVISEACAEVERACYDAPAKCLTHKRFKIGGHAECPD